MKKLIKKWPKAYFACYIAGFVLIMMAVSGFSFFAMYITPNSWTIDGTNLYNIKVLQVVVVNLGLLALFALKIRDKRLVIRAIARS